MNNVLFSTCNHDAKIVLQDLEKCFAFLSSSLYVYRRGLNLNWTLPLSMARAMKSLPRLEDRDDDICPCQTSSPVSCSVTTVISMVWSVLSVRLSSEDGSSMKPPDAGNSADVDTASTSNNK